MKPVARFKPYKDPNITRLEKSDMEVALEFYLAGHNKKRFKDLIEERYNNALQHSKERIAQTLKPLYKKPINFSNKITTEVIIKIKRILNETDKNIPELVQEFDKFFGEEVSFFKEGKPVSPEAICNAYRAITQEASKEEVKQLLYK